VITQLGYLGLSVSDVVGWEPFATEVLGLPIGERDSDGALYLRADEYHHRYTLHPAATDDLAYVGWAVSNAESLRVVKDKLLAAGVSVEQGTVEECRRRRVLDFIKCEDPAGVRLEIFYGLESSLDDPFRSSRQITGFKVGELGLGHVTVNTDDLEQSTRFYSDVLGLRPSAVIDFKRGDIEVRAIFFQCNSRAHSFALCRLPIPRRLVHFVLEAKSLDDVGATYHLCSEKGVTIAASIGRHVTDHMVSFYLVTPSGFEVGYGFGGRLVDPAENAVKYHRSTSVWGHKRPPTPALVGERET
jgi:biphenyl-2,3-diol 1,2-dioxygenase